MGLAINGAELLGIASAIGLAASSMPAHATVLRGDFAGVVASGSYSGPGGFEDVIGKAAGATIDHVFDRNEGSDSGYAGIDAPYAGAGGQAAGSVSYSAGLLRARFAFFNFSNSGAGIDFLADVVDGQLLNWRGTMYGGGQIDNDTGWGFDVVLSDLRFNGTYAGPIPEPAIWAMMIAGFGMVGTAVRRSRRTQAAISA